MPFGARLTTHACDGAIKSFRSPSLTAPEKAILPEVARVITKLPFDQAWPRRHDMYSNVAPAQQQNAPALLSLVVSAVLDARLCASAL